MTSFHDLINGGEEESEEDNDKKESPNRCFFKSTTACQRTRDKNLVSVEYGPIRAASYAAGCEYFDAAHLTDEFSMMLYPDYYKEGPENLIWEHNNIFWDSAHYQPWVYEELNNLLLNVLCNAPNDENT